MTIKRVTIVEQKRMGRMWVEGYSTGLISREVGRPQGTVRDHIAMLGLPKKRVVKFHIRKRRGVVADLFQQIFSEQCALVGVRVEDAKKHARLKQYVWARASAMKRLRAAGHSYPAIADCFGLDHTTVVHHLRNGVSDTPPPSLAEVRERTRRNAAARRGRLFTRRVIAYAGMDSSEKMARGYF
jgi:DNA-binding CsgD family transcriptional regulator